MEVCQCSAVFPQDLTLPPVGATQVASQDVSMTSFLELAKKYRLKGQTTEELCRHNSAVAASIDKQQVRELGVALIFFFFSFFLLRSSIAYVTVFISSSTWAATFRLLQGYKCMLVILVFPFCVWL